MGIAYSIAVATCVGNLFNFRHQNASTQVKFFLAIASFLCCDGAYIDRVYVSYLWKMLV